MNKVLSIIIPAYNAEPYIEHLIQRLKPQINDKVEVLVIDDGSEFPYLAPYDWVRVIRTENRGAAAARNLGIRETTGKYISFIDADDLVSERFVDYILRRAEEEWDFMDLSWKSLESNIFNYKLRNDSDRLPNPSVCTRIWRRGFLKGARFNEKKDVAEDEEFTRLLRLKEAKGIAATDYMYFYRTTTPGSLSKRYRNGETRTKRIAYYWPVIREEDTELLEEVRKESKKNEVVILTYENRIPEIEKYALVVEPRTTWAHEARGGQTHLIKLIKENKMETQVVLYVENIYKMGGIESFVFNFCNYMAKYYDICVVYENIEQSQLSKLRQIVRTQKNNRKLEITCDTLILNRVGDRIPQNIRAKQTLQMLHGCKNEKLQTIPSGRGKVVGVSNAVADSFGAEDLTVIKNMVKTSEPKNPLLLVTASRLDTPEKGQKRMLALANKMKTDGVSFIWLVFTNKPIEGAPEEMVQLFPTSHIENYMAKADYVVQLSDWEAFCYSLVEALSIGTPVITTPLPVLDEIGVKPGKNGYVIDDIETFDTTALLDIPSFKYTYNNSTQITKWKKLLGNTKPKGDYIPEKMVDVIVLKQYRDMELDRVVKEGEELKMPEDRAKEIEGAGYLKIKEA